MFADDGDEQLQVSPRLRLLGLRSLCYCGCIKYWTHLSTPKQLQPCARFCFTAPHVLFVNDAIEIPLNQPMIIPVVASIAELVKIRVQPELLLKYALGKSCKATLHLRAVLTVMHNTNVV